MQPEQKYNAQSFLIVNLTLIVWIENVRRYLVFGETLVDISNGSYETPYRFGGKELDSESGLYYFSDRYYSPPYSIPYSTDRHWYNRPNQSPYVWCNNNPIRFIDPTGMDWVENKETKKVTWNDNATSAKTTPEGYNYIGATGKSILDHYGFNSNSQNQSSTARGMVIMGEEGYHWAGAETTTSISVDANIGSDKNAQSTSNAQGLVFNGVNVTANATTISTGSTEGDMSVMGRIKVNYGGREYRGSFIPNTEPSISASGSINQTASVLLPANVLSKSNTANSSVLLRGGYGVQGTDGFYRPLVLHGLLPIPRSFKHSYNIINYNSFFSPTEMNRYSIRR